MGRSSPLSLGGCVVSNPRRADLTIWSIRPMDRRPCIPDARESKYSEWRLAQGKRGERNVGYFHERFRRVRSAHGTMFERARTERGASMVEYPLLVGLIAVVAVVAVAALGGGISNLFSPPQLVRGQYRHLSQPTWRARPATEASCRQGGGGTSGRAGSIRPSPPPRPVSDAAEGELADVVVAGGLVPGGCL